MNLIITQCSSASSHFLLVPNILLSIRSQTPSVRTLLLVWDIKFHTHTKQHTKSWYEIQYKHWYLPDFK